MNRHQSATCGVLLVLATFVIVATTLPLIRLPYWWIRVFDFPRVQLCAIGLCVLVAGWWHVGHAPGTAHGGWHIAVMALLVCALGYQAWRIRPYTPLHPVQTVGATAPDAARSFRLVISNVLMRNRSAQRWLREVRSVRPDLVVMLEPDAWWIEQVLPLRRELPYHVEHPLDTTYGIALYSRFPLHDVAVREVVEHGIPSIWGAFELPCGERVRFVFIHPRPPRIAVDTNRRDAELVCVAREVDAAAGPLVVAGDFNDVAWSDTTKLFQELSGLLDPRVGRGFYSTFHAGWPPLRWPLDHVFHSEHLALVELRRLASVASDHFPIVIELALSEAAQVEQKPPDAEAEDHERADEILDQTDK